MSEGQGQDGKASSKVHLCPESIKEPIICHLGRQFKVVNNIRRADVNGAKGWVVLEFEGTVDDIERGIAWVTSKGVRVDSVAGDIVEG